VKKFLEMNAQKLTWSQLGPLSTEYALLSGKEQIATLKFNSMFGTLATAEYRGSCWTFKRVGFWKTRVTVRECGSDKELAVFNKNTWEGGGTLEFTNGHRFNANTNFWMTDLKFIDTSGKELVNFRFGGAFRRRANVEIFPETSELTVLPLLLIFGWYLAIMLDMDATTAATTAAIIS